MWLCCCCCYVGDFFIIIIYYEFYKYIFLVVCVYVNVGIKFHKIIIICLQVFYYIYFIVIICYIDIPLLTSPTKCIYISTKNNK